jgi:hypothetical protein
MLTLLHRDRDTQNMQPNPTGASATPNVSAGDIESRREKRLHVAVPVKVFLTADVATFQLCCTYEISMVGARLVAVAGISKVGQVVWLQRHNRRAKYKVIWIGKEGTEQSGQIGVEVLEQANVIWENELKIRIMQK